MTVVNLGSASITVSGPPGFNFTIAPGETRSLTTYNPTSGGSLITYTVSNDGPAGRMAWVIRHPFTVPIPNA